VTEDPERVSMVAAALQLFDDCGYNKDWYIRYTTGDNSIWFFIPNQAKVTGPLPLTSPDDIQVRWL
jgi:hypothetical protein